MRDKIFIGIDPSFSRSGIVCFRNEDLIIAGSYASLNHKNKEVTIKGFPEFDSVGLNCFDSKSKFEGDKGDFNKIVNYFNIFNEFLHSLKMKFILDHFCIGVEIPMGAHMGPGAKVDRLYATVLLSIKQQIPEKIMTLYTYTPSEIKKFVSGKGNAKKNLIIKDVFKKWGFESEFDDVADAYGIAKLTQYIEEKKNGR